MPIPQPNTQPNKMFTLVKHETFEGVSIRQLHAALTADTKTPGACMTWFKKFMKKLHLGTDYVQSEEFQLNPHTGRNRKNIGDYLVSHTKAIEIAGRSEFKLASAVWNELKNLSPSQQASQGQVFAQVEAETNSSATDQVESAQEHIISPTTPPTDADRIVDLALIIQELKAQEMMLVTEQNDLVTRLDQVREKLTDAKADLMITLG